MTKHEKANLIYSIQEAVKQIRAVTASSRVVDICTDLCKWTTKLSDGMDLAENIREIRERRIDKTG